MPVVRTAGQRCCGRFARRRREAAHRLPRRAARRVRAVHCGRQRTARASAVAGGSGRLQPVLHGGWKMACLHLRARWVPGHLPGPSRRLRARTADRRARFRRSGRAVTRRADPRLRLDPGHRQRQRLAAGYCTPPVFQSHPRLARQFPPQLVARRPVAGILIRSRRTPWPQRSGPGTAGRLGLLRVGAAAVHRALHHSSRWQRTAAADPGRPGGRQSPLGPRRQAHRLLLRCQDADAIPVEGRRGIPDPDDRHRHRNDG